MERTESQEQQANRPMDVNQAPTGIPSPFKPTESLIFPQGNGQTCASCGSASGANSDSGTNYAHVYALGRIEARFPTMGMEKELAQATGRADTNGLTDRQALYDVLKVKEHRYLVRKLCWVFTIQGMETYILLPHDPTDFELLVEALGRNPSPMDLDCVIGMRGPLAPPTMCNGLMVPIVAFDQLYWFDRDSLLKSIPNPEAIPEDQFESSTAELFDRIIQMTDNAGATDEHRALNYLAMRYPAIYTLAADSHRRAASLTAVEVRASRLSGTRKIVDVIFSYRNRNTDVTEKFFVRVDVTEEFPFLVTKLMPYFDR